MKKILLLTLVLFSISIGLNAQKITKPKVCSTTMSSEDAKRINAKVNDYMWSESMTSGLFSYSLIKVPVVFHVLYDTITQNNEITQELLDKQIKVLNDAYRMKNSKEVKLKAPKDFAAIAIDTKIEFYIDSVIRKKTDTKAFSDFDESAKIDSLGGSHNIDPKHKLNIWICKLDEGLFGYGAWPGDEPTLDGVVLAYESIGAFACDTCWYSDCDECKTAVHEVGHYLGLLHIWGDDCSWFSDAGGCLGTDYIDDTPNQKCATYDCPDKALNSCGVETMYMNYMDYTPDACMYMFTKGQMRRMRAVINTMRTGLK